MAKSLELSLKNAREQFFVVGDGSFIPAKVIKIPVQIGNEKIIADIAFSEKLNIGFNLLGSTTVRLKKLKLGVIHFSHFENCMAI